VYRHDFVGRVQFGANVYTATMTVNAIMLGAGNRGHDVYGNWALEHEGELKFIAVADPDPAKLERFGAAHGIPAAMRFLDWQEAIRALPASSNLAAFVCLPDAQHETAAIACLNANLHLILEKPAAATLEGTRRVARAAAVSGRVVMLGYVLRHTPFFGTLREVVRSGRLGEIVTVDWRENVSSMHYAHSYVRGNWRRADDSSPMILAKCSHDLDMLGWITGLRVLKLSSFGSLGYFNAQNAPEGAPLRCLDGCPVSESCAYYAPKVYLRDSAEWPASTISADGSLQARRVAIETGPYGHCVFRNDNDVVDHQVASLEFQGGATGTFTMHGHSGEEGRSLRIDGTLATLRGVFSATKQELILTLHDVETALSGGGEIVPISAPAGMAGGGHGGGDDGLARAFVTAVRNGARDDPMGYLESHLLAFAFETARLEGRVLDMDAFRVEG
jgi:predicted dehydrogenase